MVSNANGAEVLSTIRVAVFLAVLLWQVFGTLVCISSNMLLETNRYILEAFKGKWREALCLQTEYFGKPSQQSLSPQVQAVTK